MSSETVTYVLCVVVVILFAAFAYEFPLRDRDGRSNRCLSVILAILFFPVYGVLYGIQNPIGGTGNELLTVLLVILVWPVTFLLPFFSGGRSYTTSARVQDLKSDDNNTGEWV